MIAYIAFILSSNDNYLRFWSFPLDAARISLVAYSFSEAENVPMIALSAFPSATNCADPRLAVLLDFGS
jgi:hypothetical protein